MKDSVKVGHVMGEELCKATCQLVEAYRPLAQALAAGRDTLALAAGRPEDVIFSMQGSWQPRANVTRGDLARLHSAVCGLLDVLGVVGSDATTGSTPGGPCRVEKPIQLMGDEGAEIEEDGTPVYTYRPGVGAVCNTIRTVCIFSDGSQYIKFREGGWHPLEGCYFTEEQCLAAHRKEEAPAPSPGVRVYWYGYDGKVASATIKEVITTGSRAPALQFSDGGWMPLAECYLTREQCLAAQGLVEGKECKEENNKEERSVGIPVYWLVDGNDDISRGTAVGVFTTKGKLCVRFDDGEWNPADTCYLTPGQCRAAAPGSDVRKEVIDRLCGLVRELRNGGDSDATTGPGLEEV